MTQEYKIRQIIIIIMVLYLTVISSNN